MRRYALAFAARFASATALTPPPPSRVATFAVRGRSFDVKRDDQWKLIGDGGGISGNKARKLYRLATEATFPPLVASLGGHQSNAMLALAALCHARSARFVYLAKPVPRWLRKNPAGNYARALALGMELVPLAPGDYSRAIWDAPFRTALLDDIAASLLEDAACAAAPTTTWVPQGGSSPDAEAGVALLAAELAGQYPDSFDSLTVVLPSGTGTTALFLARHLQKLGGARVVAVPCATDAAELRRQLERLDAASGAVGTFPEVLQAVPRAGEPKHRFGQPARRDIDLWHELRAAGLHVDLLYAPHAWDELLRALALDNDADATTAAAPPTPTEELLRDESRRLLYLHCGGMEGVATQLTRYRHAGLVADFET